MGGPGSERPRGAEKERLQIVYTVKGKRHPFTVYVPADDFDILEEYRLSKGLDLATFAKWLINSYLKRFSLWYASMSTPHNIKALFLDSQEKEISKMLWNIMQVELEYNEGYQRFKEEYISTII